MATILSYASAAFAFIAAVYWILSALVKTPKNFDIVVFITHSDPLGGMGRGSSTELTDLAEALVRQSNWSKVAALSAGAASLLQAVAIYIQPQ